MNRTLHAAPLLIAALVVFLAGCASGARPIIQRGADPLARAPDHRADTGSNGAVGSATTDESPKPRASTARLQAGTGRVINEQAASRPPPGLEAAGEATFNFEGEPLHAVVKAILGDLLQQNYVIAPNVQGTVTLATPRPVNGAQAMSLLEMVLGWNNTRLVWSDGRYNVVPADQAVAGNLSPRTGGAGNARGFESRAVPLKFISAAEMEKLIKPFARPQAVVSVDTARNLIVLAGTRAELENYLRTIEIFDVDWLAGMSVGVYPLQSAEAGKVVAELEKIFGDGGKTPLAGMFRFLPLEGQNAVMVITPQAKYLKDMEDWIGKMDAGGEGTRLYTYEVNYMKATDLAEQLSSVFGSGGGRPANEGSSGPPSLMPGLEPAQMRSIDSGNSGGNDNKDSSSSSSFNAGSGGGRGGGDGISIGNSENVSFSAVDENNALLVRASPAQWESIRRTIERLDTMPLQVHIEAQVAEVSLKGKLQYGVKWFFESEVFEAGLGDATGRDIWGDTGGVIDGATGLGWTFLGKNAAAVISALDGASDVHLLSTPSVLVRNNVEAKLDVGTKIPVNSTSFNPIVGDQPTPGTGSFTQVQYLDTGIILTVKPRISRDGMVFMEIEQEVSSPGATADANGNRPVEKRSLKTEAAVKSGETVMLAGLISQDASRGSSGVPGLSRIPVIGSLFGTRTDENNRQEVIILITPTVIRDPAAARRLTDEYGERFRALEPMRRDTAKPKN